MSFKKNSSYVCQNCDYQQPQWTGKCSQCGAWNSFEIIQSETKRKNSNLIEDEVPPQALVDICDAEVSHIKTGISELDRVLGGGIVEGCLCLLAGEPGAGKSTLLLSMVSHYARARPDEKILYISAEESLAQVASRAKRIGVKEKNIYFYHQTSWQCMLGHFKKIKPSLIILDSIQTTVSQEVSSAPGSLSQIKEVTFELMNYVKESNASCFVIGHISKDGGIAGPKMLEHMVDTVLYFEGEQLGNYRMIRAIKNRFGNTNEVGLFEMGADGLVSVRNPSIYFLDKSSTQYIGKSLSMIVEGSRPLFLEIQALVIENKHGQIKRIAQGVETIRVTMLIAIMEKYLNISLIHNDVYLNIVGDLRHSGRETDLSIVVSILSSFKNIKIESGLLFLGELGLSGELRAVSKLETRLKEMSLMGYKKAVVSKQCTVDCKNTFGVHLIALEHLQDIERGFFKEKAS